MPEKIQTDFLPSAKSGFTEGKCPKCNKPTFSKGKAVHLALNKPSIFREAENKGQWKTNY